MSESGTRPLAKLMVIGIDAASPALIERWMKDGALPNLAALVSRGVSSEMKGVEGFFIGSTWASMYTGTNPAEHSVHYLLELVRGTYELRESADGLFVQRPPFWRALSDAGKRVAILDVPLTRLEPQLNGVQTVEWGGHDSIFGFRTFPPSLAERILEKFGPHPVGSTCDADNRSAHDYAEFADRLERGARLKGELSREILAEGNWDFFMQVFTEAHCAGHQCWHLHDEKHPAHRHEDVAVAGDPMRRAYVAIDHEIGRLVELAGDADIVVFSGHGMSHWYGAQFLLHDILVKLGASAARPVAPRTAKRQLLNSARAVWRALPMPIRQAIKRFRGRTVAPPVVKTRPAFVADAARSRCFVHPNGLAIGGIRLNLVGREPNGMLLAGPEADAFVAELSQSLLEIVDMQTGMPLVKRVVRVADLYAGENLDLLPDLLVEWNDATATGSTIIANGVNSRVRATSPGIGIIEGANDFGRTGEHRTNGWLVAAGPHISNKPFAVQPSILDLAPTFSAMLGVESDASTSKSSAKPRGSIIPELLSR